MLWAILWFVVWLNVIGLLLVLYALPFVLLELLGEKIAALRRARAAARQSSVAAQLPAAPAAPAATPTP